MLQVMLCEDQSCLDKSYTQEIRVFCILIGFNAKRTDPWDLFIVKGVCDYAILNVLIGNTRIMHPNEFTSKMESDERDSPHLLPMKSEPTEVIVKEEKDVSDMAVIPAQISAGEKSVEEEIMVDIMETAFVEDARLHPEDQATECSSSFGASQDDLTELEDHGSVAESLLRNGSDANVLMEGSVVHRKRKKRALNNEWKTCRQGIEWRCRWLELRVRELQAKFTKYNQFLTSAKANKQQLVEQQADSTARAFQFVHSQGNRALRRQRRRKAEESVDLKLRMSKHPLFSRYEKKKHREGLSSAERTNDDENQGILEVDDLNEDDEFGVAFMSEEDSMEQLLWHIEALQMHVLKLKNHLRRGGLMQKGTLKVPSSDAPSPSPRGLGNISLLEGPGVLWGSSQLHTPGWSGAWPMLHGPKVKASIPIARRRNSEYDTDSVIMPDHVMVNYVEPVRHAFIEASHWRVLNDGAVPDGESSSNEDTDDEPYKRYSEMQVNGTLYEDSPSCEIEALMYDKETPTDGADVLNEAPKKRVDMSIGGIVVENDAKLSTGLSSILRRKRLKRKSRDVASVADTIEQLLNESCLQPVEGCLQGHPKPKMEDVDSDFK